MRFGTFHLMERPFSTPEPQVYAEHLDQIVLADELGFHNVWLTEHHFSSAPYVPDVDGEYCVSASPFALACAVARITKNVRIGSAVKVLPLEHPLRTAEDIAMADILSGGRIDVGAGVGYRQYEFEGLRIPIEQKVERFLEALDVIIGAWTTDEFSYEGKYYSVPRLTLVPRPVQKPYPPIWSASRYNAPDVIETAVKGGYNLMSNWQTADELRTARDAFAASRAEAGLNPDAFEFACIRHVFVGESEKEAQRDAAKAVEYYLKSTRQFRPVGEHERGQMIFGDPDTCIERIRELENGAKMTHLICWLNFPGLSQDQIKRSMHLFSEAVMPAFKPS